MDRQKSKIRGKFIERKHYSVAMIAILYLSILSPNDSWLSGCKWGENLSRKIPLRLFMKREIRKTKGGKKNPN